MTAGLTGVQNWNIPGFHGLKCWGTGDSGVAWCRISKWRSRMNRQFIQLGWNFSAAMKDWCWPSDSFTS